MRRDGDVAGGMEVWRYGGMGGIRCVLLCDVYGVADTGLLVVSKQNI